ncbi:MAG: hypothetical protein KME64_01430 [Scytonematopsis contorta HA4267-MV1]|jgi:hypothetical protein|nr:hypothetical protein [Scytonematopsis contorta HA4267-MV1]
MAQLPLNNIIEQIQSEIEVDFQGKGKASIRATARLAGVDDKSLRLAFESAELTPSTLAQKLLAQGFDAAELQLMSKTGIPDLAISTVLEYYALDAGRYCKEQAKLAYKAFAAIGIRSWMQQIKGWHQPVSCPTQNEQTPTLEQISQLLDLTLGKTDLDPKLIAGVKINAITHYYPALKSAAEIAKPALAILVEDELLSPKQLGRILVEKTGEVWSSQRVNKLLLARGLQTRNSESNSPAYLPTDKGKTFSKLVLNTAQGRDKTVQHLRWFKEVLGELECNN